MFSWSLIRIELLHFHLREVYHRLDLWYKVKFWAKLTPNKHPTRQDWAGSVQIEFGFRWLCLTAAASDRWSNLTQNFYAAHMWKAQPTTLSMAVLEHALEWKNCGMPQVIAGSPLCYTEGLWAELKFETYVLVTILWSKKIKHEIAFSLTREGKPAAQQNWIIYTACSQHSYKCPHLYLHFQNITCP